MQPPAPALDATTTTAGFLLVLSIVVPVAGVLLAFVLGDRYVRLVACAIIPFGLAIAVAILVALPQSNGPIVYLLGAWPPPLGIALRADGLSAVMLAVTAVVICAVAVFAASDFSPAATETRAPFAFWILLLAIWGGAEHDLPRRRPLHPLCRPGTADICRSAAGVARGPGGDAAGRAAISALCVARLRPLPAGHGTPLWPVWHARHRAAVASHRHGACRSRRGGIDDNGSSRQDRALPVAPLAAARPRRRASGSQCDPVRPGREGILLHHCTALVQRHAWPARLRRRAVARCAWRGGHRVRQHCRSAPGTIEAPDRLFDARPDRIFVLDVSARVRCLRTA